MSEKLKQFVEDYIALIEAEQFDDLIDIAYKKLTLSDISELLCILNSIGISTKKYAVIFWKKVINKAKKLELNSGTPKELFHSAVRDLVFNHDTSGIGLSDEEKQQIFDRMVWGYAW